MIRLSRRTISLSLIAAVLPLAAACGSAGNSPSSSNSTSNSLIARIQKDHKITFGVAEFAPDTFQTKSGKWTGTVVGMARAFARSLNATPVFVSTSWANIVAGLQANKYEFAIDLTYTAARSKVVDFTTPVYTEVDDLMVNPAVSHVTSWQQALGPGVTICVAKGATPDLTLTALHPKATILRLPSENDCNLALVSNRAQAHFQDWFGNSAFATVHPGYKMIIPPTPLDKGKVSFAINKGWPASNLQTIDAHLSSLISSGTWTSLAKQFSVGVPTNYALKPVPAYAYKLEGYTS